MRFILLSLLPLYLFAQILAVGDKISPRILEDQFSKKHEVGSEKVDDPLDFVSRLQRQYDAPKLDELPVFTGGLVGYFGYEIVQRTFRSL